jgi:hypothetical protein
VINTVEKPLAAQSSRIQATVVNRGGWADGEEELGGMERW